MQQMQNVPAKLMAPVNKAHGPAICPEEINWRTFYTVSTVVSPSFTSTPSFVYF